MLTGRFRRGPIADGTALLRRTSVSASDGNLGSAEFTSAEHVKNKEPRRSMASVGKSAGIQAEDALEMKRIYQQALAGP